MKRKVAKILTALPTIEGAGVRLRRGFGFNELPKFDPFLLFDHFGSENPLDYSKGFPWHPHRGIETITYVIRGEVEHADSIGNNGIIGPGDIQWMTAGSGIIHQEMPRGDREGWNAGFQLWANLPSTEKMTAPRYRGFAGSEIPETVTAEGARIKIISGQVDGVRGPVDGIATDPEYLDITVPAQGCRIDRPIREGRTAFAYIIEGDGYFGEEGEKGSAGQIILFSDGGILTFQSGTAPLRMLLVSGRPLKEPVAWYGPIVMNTREELKTAFEEYNNGTFLKK